MHICAAVDV